MSEKESRARRDGKTSGFESKISRRDFLDGVALTVTGALVEPTLRPYFSKAAAATWPNFEGEEYDKVCHKLGKDIFDVEVPPASEFRDVVVVGSGLSGLSAAHRLRDKDVVVLERSPWIGGLCTSDNSQSGVKFSSGAAYFIYPWNKFWKSWYDEIGVAYTSQIIKPPTNNVSINGRWYLDAYTKEGLARLPFPADVLKDFEEFRQDMVNWWNEKGAPTNPTDSSATKFDYLDGFSLKNYIENIKGWSPEVTRFLDYYCRSCFGVNAEGVSAWAGINFLPAEFAPTSYACSFTGGLSKIVDNLSLSVGRPRIKTRSMVVNVEQDSQGVEVTYVDAEGRPYTIHAKAAILASGKFITKHTIPDLDVEHRNAFNKFRYAAYLVGEVCTNSTVFDLGYDNWVYDEPAFVDFIVADWITYAGLGSPSRPNVITTYSPKSEAERAELRTKSFNSYASDIVTGLSKVIPEPTFQQKITEIRFYRWGHPMLIPYPNFVMGPRRIAQTPQSRLIFANGDSEGLPCVEAAFSAGIRGAEEAKLLCH